VTKVGIGIAAVIAAICFLVPSLASAAACDYWQGGSVGDWSTAANWTGGVPMSTTDVCLDNSHTNGSYTVDIDTYNPALVANSISINGSAGNLITLDILGTGGGVQVGNTLTLSNQDDGSGVGPNGAINLGSITGTNPSIGQPGAIVVTAGTLVNQGTITAESTSEEGQSNSLNGSFDNEGTLNLTWNLGSTFGTWTNSGTIDVAAGQTLTLDPASDSSSFTQTGGTIANDGSFMQNGGTFVASGGTATGNDLLFDSATMDLAGTGSGSFHIEGVGTLGSNVGAGYTLWTSGIPGYTHGTLTANSALTNSGTLEFGSLDGTHGTLTIPSGTFTNDGTMTFENTANGPDGLNGALVNNASVSAPNSVQGTGAIINSGSFSLTAGATFAATSYSQGAGGTLSLAITGGGAPVVPELQLTGAAQLAGKLSVGTTGTATGTFPVISDSGGTGAFASTTFSGEYYSVAYTSSGVSLTGPAAAPNPTPNPAPVLHIGKISGGTGKLTVRISCAGTSGKCSSASVKAAVTEHFKKGKLTAVSASKKSRTKQVTIASGSVTVAAGATKTLTLTPNGTGKALLAKYGKLSTEVTVSAGGKQLAKSKVTVHKAAKKHKKKKKKK